MNRIYTFFGFLLVFIFCSTHIFSQRQTNVQRLHQLSEDFDQQYRQASKRAASWASTHNIPLIRHYDDGTTVQLIDVEEGQPIFLITDNYGASITTRAIELMEGGSLGLDLTGEGYDKLGEWDSGAVRTTHQEFNTGGSLRVIKGDGASSLSDHSTHVAGTLIGGGVILEARGMNTNGILRAYDWSNAESEMAAAAANGLELSNHSYGTVTGWNNDNGNWVWTGDSSISNIEDYRFGYYGTQARNWDLIANNAPYYMITKSAGNDRGQGPSNAGTGGRPPVDGGEDGFDCIGSYGNAKNIMTIGAIEEVLNYTGPSSVVMSSFSGWGPVDDGRIKPEVVAKGVGTYSAGSNSNSHYSSKNGTSMAAPNAAGTMALLQQHYQNTHYGQPMLSSTLRALVIHTADEAGPHQGPDYMFGWGLINAKEAAIIISEDDVQQNVIDEIDLTQGNTYNREVNVPGNVPLKVTIAWNDPAGSVLPPALNNRTPRLINDLDLRIIGPDQTIYYPYRLDPDNPAEPPKKDGKNYVDNVEQVFIEQPQAGNYTIEVDHDGVLANNMQTFSIIISGINEYTGIPFCSEGLINPLQNSEENLLDLTIQWKHAPYSLHYKVYFGTDGDGVQTPTNIHNGLISDTPYFTANLEPSTIYYLQVIPVNDYGSNEACTDIWQFTTLMAITSYPYTMDVEDVTVPALPLSWQQLINSNNKWISTKLISHEGNHSMGCYNASGMTHTQFDNWLITPPLVVEADKEYRIRFYYRAFLPGTTERMGIYWGDAAQTEALTEQIALFSGFDGADDWLAGELMLRPQADQYGFLAFRAETEAGLGIFLDDVIIEDWGPVSLTEQEANHFTARYNDGNLYVQLHTSIANGKIQLFDSDGRLIQQQILNGSSGVINGLNLKPGVYIIGIQSDRAYLRKSVLIP